MRNAIETAELSDADLDNVSGGIGAALPAGLGSIDVTPGPGGGSLSVSGGLPCVGDIHANVSTSTPM